MRIAWNWNDLFQDATAPGPNLNLTIAGLVLSNEVELAARRGEAVLRQLGFDGIRSEYYLLSTETRNEISKPARTFGHKLLTKDGKEYHASTALKVPKRTTRFCLLRVTASVLPPLMSSAV